MSKKYTDEFLIDELHRFVRENGRTPRQFEMSPKYGYPSYRAYSYHFGSFNNGLEAANLSLVQKYKKWTGFETCCKCGCTKEQTPQWHTKDLPKSEVMCHSCYRNTDYSNGILDKNCAVAKGFISQRIVAKVLGLELKDDCNCSVNFGHPYDLYDEKKYYYINVKDSKLYDINAWNFTLTQKEIPDTYIMLGYDENRKNILRVWITDAVDDLVYNERPLKSKTITNSYGSLKRAKPWEVDAKPYNEALHNMDLDKCSVLRSD